MKIRFVVLASVIAVSGAAYGQNHNNSIGVDVTPEAQVDINSGKPSEKLTLKLGPNKIGSGLRS